VTSDIPMKKNIPRLKILLNVIEDYTIWDSPIYNFAVCKNIPGLIKNIKSLDNQKLLYSNHNGNTLTRLAAEMSYNFTRLIYTDMGEHWVQFWFEGNGNNGERGAVSYYLLRCIFSKFPYTLEHEIEQMLVDLSAQVQTAVSSRHIAAPSLV